MLADLLNCGLARMVVGPPCINVSQQGGSRTARCFCVGVLLHCSDYSLAIDPATAPIFFRPAKLPNIRSVLTMGLNDAPLLHGCLLLE